MTTEYFGPLEDQGFGVGPAFNYDKFKQWLEGQQLNFKRTLSIQGDLLGNWDGAAPLDLSSIDSDATTGFAADASEGNVQFNGSVFAAGIALFDANNDNTQVGAIGGSNDELLINNVGSKNLRLQTLTGGDIKFQPGSGGRVTLNDGSTDLWTFRVVSGVPTMEWRPADLTNIGFIKMGADNIGGGDIGTISIQAPYDSGQAELTITNAASGDGGSVVAMNSFNQVLIPAGTAAKPGLVLSTDNDTGIYSPSGNQFGVATGGTLSFLVGTTRFLMEDGSEAAPNAFIDDTNTGFYRVQADDMGISLGGVLQYRFSTAAGAGFRSVAVRDTTTGAGANTFINATTGLFARSTSSLKFKEGWAYADEKALAKLELPTPITWEDEFGGAMLGFGVEHLHEMLPAVSQDFDNEGNPENYDSRSLIAILSSKIKRLESLPMIKALL